MRDYDILLSSLREYESIYMWYPNLEHFAAVFSSRILSSWICHAYLKLHGWALDDLTAQ
jgi:hypothetical protein